VGERHKNGDVSAKKKRGQSVVSRMERVIIADERKEREIDVQTLLIDRPLSPVSQES